MKSVKVKAMRLLNVLIMSSVLSTVSAQNNELVLLEMETNMEERLVIDDQPSFQIRQLEPLIVEECNMNQYSNKEMLNLLLPDPLAFLETEELLMIQMDLSSANEPISLEFDEDMLKNLRLEIRSGNNKLIKEKRYQSGKDIFSEVMHEKKGKYILVLKSDNQIIRKYECIVSQSARF